MVGPHNREENVASITTISSPHLGFQLADDVLAARGLGPAFLNALTTLTSTLFLGPAESEMTSSDPELNEYRDVDRVQSALPRPTGC